MKKSFLISAFSAALLSIASLPSYAYTIVNQTSHSVNIVQTAIGGLRTTLAPGQTAFCFHGFFSCRGTVVLRVMPTTSKPSVLCRWYGHLNNVGGDTFVIKENGLNPYPNVGSCDIEFSSLS